ADDLAARGAESVGHRGPPAAVGLVEDELDGDRRMVRHDPAEDLPGAVPADVVDEDDLVGPAEVVEDLADLGEARREHLLLVVAGHDDAQPWAGGHRFRAAPA